MLRIRQRIDLVEAVEVTWQRFGKEFSKEYPVGSRGWVTGIEGDQYRIRLDEFVEDLLVGFDAVRCLAVEQVEGVVEDIDYCQYGLVIDPTRPAWDLHYYDGRRIRVTVEVLD